MARFDVTNLRPSSRRSYGATASSFSSDTISLRRSLLGNIGAEQRLEPWRLITLPFERRRSHTTLASGRGGDSPRQAPFFNFQREHGAPSSASNTLATTSLSTYLFSLHLRENNRAADKNCLAWLTPQNSITSRRPFETSVG